MGFNCLKATEPLREDSLHFTTKSQYLHPLKKLSASVKKKSKNFFGFVPCTFAVADLCK